MSILTLEAKLERQESSTPWGFRMQGGKDFSSPITIARVRMLIDNSIHVKSYFSLLSCSKQNCFILI